MKKNTTDQRIDRRSFLQRGACAALGLSGLTAQLFNVRMVQAALQQRSFSDYKALVCLFLYGGNDNGNTVIPYAGGPQNYSFYQNTRANLVIPQADLANTIITPSNAGGRSFAFHPGMTDMKTLFDQGHLAWLTNVGTLVQPTTRQEIMNDTAKLPPQLFAHNSQTEQWQISTADATHNIGWGGRVADALHAAGANPNANVSMNISITGANYFLSGRQITPYTVSAWGPEVLRTWGLSSWSERQVPYDAFLDLLNLQHNPNYSRRHAMQKAYADIADRAVVNSEVIEALLDKPSAISTQIPPDNNLANQLAMVARLIEYAQTDLQHQRQIFLVAIGGFDNHDGLLGGGGTDLGPHGNNLRAVNDGVMYFWNALGDLNMRDKVTLFTASDFGRTYLSNGNGSDHGWASEQFVLGGPQVNGGQMFGTFPDLTPEGPDDTDRGRYIPQTSVDAYSFELARWLGVPTSEMSTVFPNLSRFLDVNNPSTHLGFMS
jgi:uncharacterized protein (DUF1501 family)